MSRSKPIPVPGDPKTVCAGFIINDLTSIRLNMLCRLQSVWTSFGIHYYASEVLNGSLALTQARRLANFEGEFNKEIAAYLDRLLPSVFVFVADTIDLYLPIRRFVAKAEKELASVSESQLRELVAVITKKFFESELGLALARKSGPKNG